MIVPSTSELNFTPTSTGDLSASEGFTGTSPGNQIEVAEPAAEIVTTNVVVPVPRALVAPMVTLVVPTAVGVPDMTPVVASIKRPAGSGSAL